MNGTMFRCTVRCMVRSDYNTVQNGPQMWFIIIVRYLFSMYRNVLPHIWENNSVLYRNFIWYCTTFPPLYRGSRFLCLTWACTRIRTPTWKYFLSQAILCCYSFGSIPVSHFPFLLMLLHCRKRSTPSALLSRSQCSLGLYWPQRSID